MEDLLVNGVGPLRIAAVSLEPSLSTAPLLRRSILAVLTSLLLENEIDGFLSPADHSARPM